MKTVEMDKVDPMALKAVSAFQQTFQVGIVVPIEKAPQNAK